MSSSTCIVRAVEPYLYVIILGLFVFAVSKISKRNIKLYQETLDRQKEMMERQKESVQLLREIRDLLKK